MAPSEQAREVLARYRDAKRDVTIRFAESAGRNPENVALALDDLLRLVADVVQSSILRDRSRWRDSLVDIVKEREYGVDPFDQSATPATGADAVLKLLCIYARMIGDDIFAEVEEQLPPPTWHGKEPVFDAGQKFLHKLHLCCRGLWIETKYPTSEREAFDGGIGRKPAELWRLVPTELSEAGLSFPVLDGELQQWLVLGFGRVFGGDDPPAGAAGGGKKPKGRRTRPKGVGQELCRAKWIEHHEYENGRCFNDTPLSINELRKSADNVAYNTARKFFDIEFEAADEGSGYRIYERACRDRDRLNDFGRKIAREARMADMASTRLVEQYIGENGSALQQFEHAEKLSDNRRDNRGDDE